MPDLWTHIICGREVLAGMEERFEASGRDQNLYFLGCQGPDMFFYHDYSPWSENNLVFALAGRIHHQRCGLFFRESLKYAKNNPGPGLTVYLAGLICHWCLDRATHPYINYISGVYRGNKNENRKLINNHKRVEAAIDVLMGLRIMGLRVWKVPVQKHIQVGDNLPGEIESFYRHVLPLVFPDRYQRLKGSDFVNESYRQMIRALKVLYDPWGAKRLLASLYDSLSGGAQNLRYYFFRPPGRGREAYLNEKRRAWCHPMDAGEISTDSFADLFRRGVEDSVHLSGLALRYIRGEAGDGEINQKFVDISYSTGKPEADGRPMVYFSPVLEGEDF